MDERKTLQGWQWALIWIAGITAFVWIGGEVADAIPRRYHRTLEAIGNWTLITAVGGVALWFAHKLPAREHPGWRYALWTTLVLGGCLHFWFLSDDGCYVDWDGRSNPTVCE